MLPEWPSRHVPPHPLIYSPYNAQSIYLTSVEPNYHLKGKSDVKIFTFFLKKLKLNAHINYISQESAKISEKTAFRIPFPHVLLHSC